MSSIQRSQAGDYHKPNPSGTPNPSRLAELFDWRQWVTWKWKKQDGAWKKPPYNPVTSKSAKTTKPETWGTYEQAVTTAAAAETQGMSGIGFVCTPEDPYSFLDLDSVRDRESGAVQPWAVEVVKRFCSYTETSPSGTGLRIAIKARMGFKKAGTKPVEIFSGGGYVTITGNVYHDAPIHERQEELERYYAEVYPAPTLPAGPMPSGPELSGPGLSDGEVVERLRKGPFGHDFAALFDRGDTSRQDGDESRADNALMGLLAFQTSHDAAQMERIFSEGALGQREKWTGRPKYRRDTIDYAIRHNKAYTPRKHQPKETKTRDEIAENLWHIYFDYPWAKVGRDAQTRARDFFAMKMMLEKAHEANSTEIGMSVREMTTLAGFGRTATTEKALTSLQDLHRGVVKLDAGGPGSPARYKIKPVTDSIRGHSKIRGTTTPPCVDNENVLLLSQLRTEKIRNTSPITEKTHDKNGRRIPKGKADPVCSVGQVAAWILALIEAAGTHLYGSAPVPVDFLVERTGIRRNNLLQRHVPKLLAAGLIVEVEGGYVTPEDAELRLARELRDSGCNAKARRQERAYKQQRDIHHMHRLLRAGVDFDGIARRMPAYSVAQIMDILVLADRAPTVEEMDQERHERQIRNASGTYSELVPESPYWEGEFPGPSDDGEGSPQPLLGHSPDAPAEARECPVTASAAVQRVEVPQDRHGASEEPCHHSYGGHVYPGGRGCYSCDPDHPLRGSLDAEVGA